MLRTTARNTRNPPGCKRIPPAPAGLQISDGVTERSCRILFLFSSFFFTLRQRLEEPKPLLHLAARLRGEHGGALFCFWFLDRSGVMVLRGERVWVVLVLPLFLPGPPGHPPPSTPRTTTHTSTSNLSAICAEQSRIRLSMAGGRARSHRVSAKTEPVVPSRSPVAQHRCRQSWGVCVCVFKFSGWMC